MIEALVDEFERDDLDVGERGDPLGDDRLRGPHRPMAMGQPQDRQAPIEQRIAGPFEVDLGRTGMHVVPVLDEPPGEVRLFALPFEMAKARPQEVAVVDQPALAVKTMSGQLGSGWTSRTRACRWMRS